MEKRVGIEVASKLKDLGFKENVNAYFEDGELKIHNNVNGWDFNSSFLTCVSAPHIGDAFDWFEDNHKLFVSFDKVDNTRYFYYDFQIINSKDREFYDEDMIDQARRNQDWIKYPTKEQARQKALEKLIEIVENEKVNSK